MFEFYNPDLYRFGVLGTAVVTENLIGGNSDLIRDYGGFSVISGYVYFSSDDNLDARYCYITSFREPID